MFTAANSRYQAARDFLKWHGFQPVVLRPSGCDPSLSFSRDQHRMTRWKTQGGGGIPILSPQGPQGENGAIFRRRRECQNSGRHASGARFMSSAKIPAPHSGRIPPASAPACSRCCLLQPSRPAGRERPSLGAKERGRTQRAVLRARFKSACTKPSKLPPTATGTRARAAEKFSAAPARVAP